MRSNSPISDCLGTDNRGSFHLCSGCIEDLKGKFRRLPRGLNDSNGAFPSSLEATPVFVQGPECHFRRHRRKQHDARFDDWLYMELRLFEVDRFL
jgi:hypothetical protein